MFDSIVQIHGLAVNTGSLGVSLFVDGR